MKTKMKTKMKKLLCLVTVTLLVITSCSKDESVSEPVTDTNSTEPITKVLVKKKIRTYSANDIVTTTYKYDGNKIVSASNDGGFVANYTYTGNLITKIEERVDNNFQSSQEYTYVDGKLATEVFKRNYGGTISYAYTYNANGTISYKLNQSGTEGSAGILTIVNGNIVKIETFLYGILTVTQIFEYDNKHNPFKNVLGFNLLIDTYKDMFFPNNRTKDSADGPDVNYTFKYDQNNFPTEKKRNNVSSGGSNDLTQYFY
ncbi:hypothetical protein EKL97_14175 [Flavobacterium sp. LS1P28]|uniref:hypothetical protein n=1 Tax=Flavobacterium sp. LS1P28 TaxID=2497752 RepID=UPI000F81B03C|nr:hypothetical protein [Flavobacterium sp. LS1P28]RTY78247.1 hypothetical protein EKL97_14175 [Flavobacterium sp. LS1P28]